MKHPKLHLLTSKKDFIDYYKDCMLGKSLMCHLSPLGRLIKRTIIFFKMKNIGIVSIIGNFNYQSLNQNGQIKVIESHIGVCLPKVCSFNQLYHVLEHEYIHYLISSILEKPKAKGKRYEGEEKTVLSMQSARQKQRKD